MSSFYTPHICGREVQFGSGNDDYETHTPRRREMDDTRDVSTSEPWYNPDMRIDQFPGFMQQRVRDYRSKP